MPVRDIIFLIVIVPLIPLCFFRPFLGILAWTWMSYFNPHRFTWGITKWWLPAGMLVAVPTLLGLSIARDRRLPPLTRETVLLLLLWIWFGVTTLNVYYSPVFFHHWDDTINKLGEISKMLLMTFVCLMLVINRERLRWWYLVTGGCFALLALKGAIFGFITGGELRVYGPALSMVEDNNDFALALNMSIPIFYFLSLIETSRAIRLALRISVVICVISVVLTYSRGGLVGLGVVLIALAFRSKRKLATLTGVVVLGILLFALAPAKWIERMKTIQTADRMDPSAISRLRSWEFATRLARDYPLFGGGFETFTAPLYENYNLREEAIVHGPHSIYFQMLGEHGVPGLAMFLTLMGSCFLSCRKIRRRFRSGPGSWMTAYANMIDVSLVAYAASGAFLGRAYFDLFYQLVAATIILKSLARKELARERSEAPGEPAESRLDVAAPVAG